VQECNGVLLFVVTTDLDISSSGKRYKREAVILEFVLDPPDKPRYRQSRLTAAWGLTPVIQFHSEKATRKIIGEQQRGCAGVHHHHTHRRCFKRTVLAQTRQVLPSVVVTVGAAVVTRK
jgi:hypothetical protein